MVAKTKERILVEAVPSNLWIEERYMELHSVIDYMMSHIQKRHVHTMNIIE